MHIDVDESRIAFDEQGQRRMAVARQEIGIGAAHRADQQLVAHRPAVDEQKLHLRIGAVVGGNAGKAEDAHAFARGLHRHGIVGELAAHQARQALEAAREQIGFGRKIEHALAVQRQRESDVGARHGQTLDDVAEWRDLPSARI